MGLNEASRVREQKRDRRARYLKIGLIVAGIVAVVGVGVTVYLRVSAPTKEDYLERGNARVKDGQPAEATIEYRNALRLDPSYVEARHRLADAYLQAGQLVNAMGEYIRTADVQPTNTVAQLQAIKFLLLARRFEDARERATTVLKNEPQNVEAQIAKAMATARIVDLDNGLFELRNALSLNPSDPRSHILLGVMEGGSGNLKEAEAAFKHAVELAPKSVNAVQALATFYWRTGRLKETEQLLRKAVTMDPSLPESHRRLATLLVATNRAAEAEAPLKAVAEATKAVEAQLALGDYYFNQSRDAEAITVFERAARHAAGFASAKIRLARILYIGRKPDDAHKALSDALSREPNNTEALMLRAQFQMAENNTSAALKTAQDAVAGAPGSAIARTLLAEVLSSRSQFEDAIASFNEAIRLNPVLEPAKMSLLYLELQRGDIRRAEELANEALRENSFSVPVRLARAQVNALKGAPDLAIRDLNLVLANYPDHALALARLGEVHLRRRNFAAARAAFDKAGAADPRLFEALRGRVNLAMMEKRAADANALVEARLARSPEDVDTLMLGARIYAAQGNFDRQETALMKVIEVQPGNMSALAVLANLYVDLNKLDSALVRYQELSSGPMAVGAQTMLGLIYQTQNKPLEARAVFEKLLAAKPDTHVAANNLAWIYAETGGNLDGALQLAQDAVRMNPGSADYNDTLGWIYLKKDLASPAIAAFQTALRARPQSPEFHYHLGLAYRKADQPERAIQELQTALRYKADMRDAQVALDAVRAESKKKPS